MFSKIILFTLLFGGLAGTISVYAQSPTPTPSPSADTSFGAAMGRFAESAARIVPVFTEEFVKPLAAYMMPLAWLIAILCFFVMFISLLGRNDGADKEFLKWLLSSVFLFCLLAYSGDANGDGKFGDVVNYFQTIGNSLAYGQLDSTGQVESGSFIQNKIKEQRTAYEAAYKDFVNKSFTVVTKPGETAVIMPSTTAIEDRLFVKDSNGYNAQRVKDAVNPEGWNMSSLFEWLNLSRGIMEIADLFLLILTGLLIAAMKITFPLMVAISIHKDLRAKTGTAFFWAMGVVTLVVPFFTQILRFGVYLAANLAFAAASPTTDYYTFDPSTQSILASGNPVYIIFLMCFLMCIMALLIFASPYLAFQVATGNIVNGLIGAVSGWFSGLASIGISTYTSALAGSYSYQAQEQSALKTFGQMEQQATDNRQIQYSQAEGQYRGEVVGATSSYASGQVSAIGGYNADLVSNRGTYANTVAGIGIDANKEIATTVAEGNKQLGQNQIDYRAGQMGAQSELAESKISATPELADLKTAVGDEKLAGMPIIGSVFSTLGANGNMVRGIQSLQGDYKNRQFDIEQTPQNPAAGTNGNAPVGNNPLPSGMVASHSTQLPIPSGDEYRQQITPPKSIRLAPMLPAPQMQPLQQYASGNSEHMGGAEGYSPQIGSSRGGSGGKKMGGVNGWYMNTLNDEMVRRGYTPQARAVMLANFMRENGNPATAFNGHIDPAKDTARGIIRNSGIISWNGDRLDKMHGHLRGQGISVSKDGRIEQTPRAVRAMVGFMDNEMKGYGVRSDMYNPNVGVDRLNRDMRKYIGFSDKPIYDNVGKNARNFQKVMPLVRATSGGNTPSTIPQFNGSKAQQMMQMRQIPVSKGRGGDTYQPSTVQRTPPPQMNDGVAEMKTLQNMSNVEAKAHAPVKRANVAYQNKSGVNAFKRDEQADLTRKHTNEVISISQRAGFQKSAAAGEFYTTQNQSSGIRASAGLQSKYIEFQGGMQRAGIGLQTSRNVADMSFERDFKVAESQKNITIEAARLNAMSNIIQSVGSSVGHQLGEAFEKFNRF